MKIKSTWTIFGVGYFITDIIDTIESQNGEVSQIVLNQEIDAERIGLVPKNITIVDIKSFKPRTSNYFFGFINANKQPILDLLKKTNITFSNLIHPFSSVSKSAVLGQGNFVGAGAVIGPDVKIGNFNIIKRSASIGHHTVLGNYNHIAPAAIITGSCKIGDKNFFGAGSTLIDNKVTGDEIIIGAGSVVIQDLNEAGTYVGVPARKLNK